MLRAGLVWGIVLKTSNSKETMRVKVRVGLEQTGRGDGWGRYVYMSLVLVLGNGNSVHKGIKVWGNWVMCHSRILSLVSKTKIRKCGSGNCMWEQWGIIESFSHGQWQSDYCDKSMEGLTLGWPENWWQACKEHQWTRERVRTRAGMRAVSTSLGCCNTIP
jgi:hypothetical protein